MGIKSTRTLSRKQALEMYHDLRGKLYGVCDMTNYELETELDRMADEWALRNGTVCFDNFSVVDDWHLDRDD